ncbi:MAG: hypothetical protein BMS9Abin18_1045 [Zetaproteobacteria bacterium]|nr:MAG: hypothetical protein BMS9Abin18_1045 [Zetaproteobacteria bacterium]
MAVVSLRKRANRNVGISLVMLVILVGTAGFAANRANESFESLNKLYGEQIELERFRASLGSLLAPLNDFSLTGNKADAEKLTGASKEFSRLDNDVRNLSALSEKDLKELKEVSGLMQQVIDMASSIVSGKIPASQAKNVTVVAQNLVFVAQEKVNAVATGLNERLNADVKDKRQQLSTLAIASLVVILLLVLVLVISSRYFISSSANMITDIAYRVTNASGDILSAVDQQASASGTQAKSVEHVTDEMEDLSRDSQQIAKTSKDVVRIADATRKSAGEGGQAVADAIRYMERIRDEVSSIAEKVTFAGEKAAQITESIGSIQEIAEETHLLALNASIESAAAGEFGKRFAVVAGEVRRLSERVREFTSEIQTVVDDVHRSSQDSIAVTREGLEEVAKGVEIAKRAGEALRMLQTMSEKTSQAVQHIAKATDKQDASNREFIETMRQISQLLNDSNQQMQTTRESASHLRNVAEELHQMV